MKFGPVPLDQAEGAILAHSIPLPQGRLRKGIILTAQDVETLRALGHPTVTVAQAEPGDIPEDRAAQRLAQALTSASCGLGLGPAGTGRVNIFADAAGIAAIDAAKITAANSVNSNITVATVPPFMRMDAGGMLATVKIISYAVPETDLDAACVAAAAGLSLHLPQIQSVSLIETYLPGAHKPPAGADAIRARVERLGVGLDHMDMALHREPDLAHALVQSKGEAILILTASATSDARDVAPAALARAGGRLLHFGLPVDPGNLLFIGALGGRPVIGLPGCARSIALNGADWVLERVLCGQPPSAQDLMAMGVGGLLKEIPTRPSPRQRKR